MSNPNALLSDQPRKDSEIVDQTTGHHPLRQNFKIHRIIST